MFFRSTSRVWGGCCSWELPHPWRQATFHSSTQDSSPRLYYCMAYSVKCWVQTLVTNIRFCLDPMSVWFFFIVKGRCGRMWVNDPLRMEAFAKKWDVNIWISLGQVWQVLPLNPSCLGWLGQVTPLRWKGYLPITRVVRHDVSWLCGDYNAPELLVHVKGRA